MTIKISDEGRRPRRDDAHAGPDATEYGPNDGWSCSTLGPLELPLTVNLRLAGRPAADSTKGALDYVPIPDEHHRSGRRPLRDRRGRDQRRQRARGDEIVRVTLLDGDAYDLNLSNQRCGPTRPHHRPAPCHHVRRRPGRDERARSGDDAAFFFHRTGPLTSELREDHAGGTAVELGLPDVSHDHLLRSRRSSAGGHHRAGLAFPGAFRTVTLTVNAGPQYNVNP